MSCTIITRATFDALPRLNQAVAKLMQEEGRIEIVEDENIKTRRNT